MLIRNLQLPEDCSPSVYFQEPPRVTHMRGWVLLLQEAEQASAGGHVADQADGELLLPAAAPGPAALPWRTRGRLPLCYTLLDVSLSHRSLSSNVSQTVMAWFLLTAVSLLRAPKCRRGWAMIQDSYQLQG